MFSIYTAELFLSKKNVSKARLIFFNETIPAICRSEKRRHVWILNNKPQSFKIYCNLKVAAMSWKGILHTLSTNQSSSTLYRMKLIEVWVVNISQKTVTWQKCLHADLLRLGCHVCGSVLLLWRYIWFAVKLRTALYRCSFTHKTLQAVLRKAACLHKEGLLKTYVLQ